MICRLLWRIKNRKSCHWIDSSQKMLGEELRAEGVWFFPLRWLWATRASIWGRNFQKRLDFSRRHIYNTLCRREK